MKMLNLGCGAWWHPDWINLDLESHSPDVIAHDLSQGIPFDNDSVDVCYSSHVLEHLRTSEADVFLREQYRVLKPGGIIRVIVPDLEQICRLYLTYLDELTAGRRDHEFQYDYSLLEIFDQTTRDVVGGGLRSTWESLQNDDQRAHAVSRHGGEYEAFMQRQQQRGTAATKSTSSFRVDKLVRKGRRIAAQAAVRVFMGSQGVKAFREGVFRNSGEIHRVMYDRYRLGRLLKQHGFNEGAVCQANESRIPGFADYRLDLVDGKIRKPDSLFMEAVK